MRPRVVLLALLVACHAKREEPQPAVDVAAPATTAPPASAAPSASAALAPVDRAAYAAYTSALVRGRRATIAKSYAAAKAAFTDALRARPNDKRALAERGYAEMLAGDSSAAQLDLDAARFTDDKALAAQAWFNLGLLGESPDGGASDDALADFWFSNQLHPSSAAKAKIAGRSICPVTIDAKHVAATHATSWLAVAKLLQSGGASKGCPAPKTDADAKALAETPGLSLGASGTFYVVRSATMDTQSCYGNDTNVVQARGSDFWIYPSLGAGAVTWNMPTQPSVDLARFGARVRATATMSWPEEQIMCTTASDAAAEVFPCRGDPGEEPAGMAHPQSDPDYTDFFIDPVAHELVLHVEDHASGRFGYLADGGRSITLRPDADGVSIAGLGCARTLPVH